MIKGEAPFVRGTSVEIGKGNKIHTFNTHTSGLQQLLLAGWRNLNRGYICSQTTYF